MDTTPRWRLALADPKSLGQIKALSGVHASPRFRASQMHAAEVRLFGALAAQDGEALTARFRFG
jgi:hypothetical protein